MTASQGSHEYAGSLLPGRTPSRRASAVDRLVRWSLLILALSVMVVLLVANWSSAGDHHFEPVGGVQVVHRMS